MAWGKMCTPTLMGGLGSKRLSSFNVALLAKQGWRLLTNPSSLTSRIYKASYYSQCDFFDAKLGANPSFCWRSILAGQDLLGK